MTSVSLSNVLVYLAPMSDHSAALRRAVSLAALPESDLSVASVVETWPAWLRASLLGPSAEVWEREYLDESLMRLKALTLAVSPSVPLEQIYLLRGRPVAEVVRDVLRRGFDIVIKDIDEDYLGQESGVGGLDWHLLRKCPCPLWLVRGMPKSKRILVALALAETEEDVAFNARLMGVASQIAAAQSGEIHVAQVLDFSATATLLRHVPEDEVVRARTLCTQSAMDGLRTFLAPFDFSTNSSRVHVIEGTPDDVIPAVANKLQADTVVIGSVARSGIAGHLIGNTAEQIIGKLRCSLCAVKPVHWTSPITL